MQHPAQNRGSSPTEDHFSPEITVPVFPTRTPIRQLLVVLTVGVVIAGAWVLGRLSSPTAASSPADPAHPMAAPASEESEPGSAGSGSDGPGFDRRDGAAQHDADLADLGVVAAEFRVASEEWLRAEKQLLLSIGNGLEVLKAAEQRPSLATHPDVAQLSKLLRRPLPSVPPSVAALSKQRENGDPTGKVPPRAWQEFLAANDTRSASELAADTRMLRDANDEASSTSRAISRRATSIAKLLAANETK